MKFFPILPLALVLAAGVAGAAAAQSMGSTATNAQQPASPGWNPSHQTQPNAAQPGSSQAMTSPSAAAAPSDSVRTAQAQLHALGLYNSAVDGRMDPDTRAAIARFQQQNGLRRTENLDQPTLARLMANRPLGYGSSQPETAAQPGSNPVMTSPPPGAGGNTTTGQSTYR